MQETILNDLKGENNEAFGQLYLSHFKMVRSFVLKNNGSPDDAEDLFQDVMLVLVEKLRQDHFVLSASLKTYIMAISKNLWLKRLKGLKPANPWSEAHDALFYEEINLAIEEEKDLKDILQTLLHKITAHCRGLIHDIFFKEKDIAQIQQEYGYSTKQNAQNQKHKCMEQIRKVKEKSGG